VFSLTLSCKRLVLVAALAVPALLPARALAASGAEIPILIAVQNGTDGKPLAAPPAITAIVNQLAIESNLNLVLKAYPWRRALWMAEQGEGFIYGAAATPERLGTLSFSRPLYEVGQWLVVSRQRMFSFTGWDDLKGKVLAIQTGAHYMGEFEALRGTLFTVQENSESTMSRLKMLALNRVDAVVVDSHRNAGQLETRLNCAYAELGKWVVLPKPVSTEPALLAIATGSPLRRHLDDFNAAIERLNQQGGVRKVVDQQQTVKPACA
jgi:polar amino acid transport system substrate-binding protein